MSVITKKGGVQALTFRVKALSEADVPGGPPKKQLLKRAKNAAAIATASPRPRKAKLQADDLGRYVKRKPIPQGVAGIADKNVVEVAIAETAKDFQGRTITVDQFIGRLWERLMLRAPNVHARLAGPLNDSIGMQLYFLERMHSSLLQIDPKTGRLYGGTGFFDASGRDVHLTDEGVAALIGHTRGLGKFASANPDALKNKHLVYADRFRIGGREYVDGAILMQFEDRYIVLLRIEAKTEFSGGVDSQLGAFFPRLASSRADQKIDCYIDGRYVEDLGRDKLLFNPTWTDSGVGVQEWGSNRDVWKDARAWSADSTPDGIAKRPTGELGDRLDSAGRRLRRSPAGQRSAFIETGSGMSGSEQLAALSVSGPVLYAKANMREIRSWILGIVQASRR